MTLRNTEFRITFSSKTGRFHYCRAALPNLPIHRSSGAAARRRVRRSPRPASGLGEAPPGAPAASRLLSTMV